MSNYNRQDSKRKQSNNYGNTQIYKQNKIENLMKEAKN